MAALPHDGTEPANRFALHARAALPFHAQLHDGGHVAYASIDPRMWDDEKFVALDDSARLLWVYLITGPEAINGPPGLIVIGTAGLSEALRRSTQDIASALDRLRASGMVEVDPLHRLIRVPKAPLYRAPGNPNVVRGWYRRWTSLPNSQLKYAQLESMREALALVEVSGSSREMFEQTFGRDLARRMSFRQGEVRPELQLVAGGQSTSLSTASVTVQLPMNLEAVQPLACSAAGSDGHVREPFPNGSRMADTEIRNVYVDQDRLPEQIPEPSRDPWEAAPEPYAPPPAPSSVPRGTPPAAPEPPQELAADPVPALALELRKRRLALVERLRREGIGASLPTPSLHDEVSRGEPDRLVRAWVGAAVCDGLDPANAVFVRGTQLLLALEASARRDKSIAGLRETVCYTPKVVDWAMTTEAASARRGPELRRGHAAESPAMPRPEFPKAVTCSREEIAASQAELRDFMARSSRAEEAVS